jgi:hypothetical protein
MADVQQIETAIGEGYGFAVAAPFGDPFLQFFAT